MEVRNADNINEMILLNVLEGNSISVSPWKVLRAGQYTLKLSEDAIQFKHK